MANGLAGSSSANAALSSASGNETVRAGSLLRPLTNSFSQSRAPSRSRRVRSSVLANTSSRWTPSLMSSDAHESGPVPRTHRSVKARTAAAVPSTSDPWIASIPFLTLTNQAPFASHGCVDTKMSPARGEE